MIFFIFSFFIIQCIIADETEAYQVVLNNSFTANMLHNLMISDPIRIEIKNFKRLDDSIITNAASQVKMTDTVIYVFSCYISLNKN